MASVWPISRRRRRPRVGAVRVIGHSVMVAVLTVLTQLGGLAWIIALIVSRGAIRRLGLFAVVYAALGLGAYVLAPVGGRVALPCFGSDAGLAMQSPLYCALNRHYVTPEAAAVAGDLARHLAGAYPGTVTLALDGGFPFLDGFPLLPHLSHDDGAKLDLAFWYMDGKGGYLPGRTRSPLGYFAFEDGPTDCPPRRLTMRWDLDWLQGAFPALDLEPGRTAAAMRYLSADPRVSRIFLEPHLVDRLGVAHAKVRFQGCRAARHDDHIHVEVLTPGP